MSLNIPYSFVSYFGEQSRGKWDQNYIERMLAGEEGRPSMGYQFIEAPWTPDDGHGRVVVFPAGAYGENGVEHRARYLLEKDLAKLEWCVLIATSDERQTFRWAEISPWPAHVTLWVMLPQASLHYPPRTRFIVEGSPMSAREIRHIAAPERDLDLVFQGQAGHVRRDQAIAAMTKMMFDAQDFANERLHVKVTPSFAGGDPQDQYMRLMTRGWVAPCPSGFKSQSSFRFYEALEAGCIPIKDGLSPIVNDDRFWDMVGLDDLALTIHNWDNLPAMTEWALEDRHFNAAWISSRWQQFKRRLLHQLHDDVFAHMRIRHGDTPHDEITVIVPTSPVPSNPDLSMIQATIASIRTDLPGAEILITCDGVRDEQLDQTDAYNEFLHRLCVWTLGEFNVTPLISRVHLHQSGMLRNALDYVRTPYIFYVEHDTPLVGTINYAEVLAAMKTNDLNLMRFLHEHAPHPEWTHLYLDEVERNPATADEAMWCATIQWSQRPHVARTDFYREIIDTYFGLDSRTFIEDLMHGVVQHDTYASRIHAVEAWKRWRMAVYAPEGSWLRSTHLDGRQADPKYPIRVAYDGDKPEGAMAPGVYDA